MFIRRVVFSPLLSLRRGGSEAEGVVQFASQANVL
jgi:hypothetical protein